MSAGYAVQEGRGRFVRMDFNEGPPPPAALLQLDLAGCLTLYPEYGQLKAAAGAVWGVAPERLVPVNGADEGIHLALRLLGGAGLVLPEPAFPMYRIYAAQLDLPVAPVPMGPGGDLDPQAVLAAPGGLLALTSPNNPTGRAIPLEVLERLLDAGRPVLLDETYAPFCGQDGAPLLERYPNLVLLRTLSKAYGVPGLRCGFLLASEELAARFDRLRSPFNVNAVAAALGARLLREDLGFRDRLRAAVAARRGLQYRLEAAGYRTLPSDVHFFLAGLGADAPAKLRAQGILIKDQGALAPGLCRVSVASAAEADLFLHAFLGDLA